MAYKRNTLPTSAGRKVQRGRRDLGEVMRKVEAGDSLQFFFRAVVTEVIHNSKSFDMDKMARVHRVTSKNAKGFLLDCPRNTIIAKVLGAASKSFSKEFAFYPFFPPHLGLPVKIGEQVWVFNENGEFPADASPGYWICRISSVGEVDDINYTHDDRKFRGDRVLDPSGTPGTIDTYNASITAAMTAGGAVAAAASTATSGQDYAMYSDSGEVGFPNGNNLLSGLTLPGNNSYAILESKASANNMITYEPVPRFTKRPGDLVLQGSNNTLVWLGEDRTSAASVQEDGFTKGRPAEDQTEVFAGAGNFAGTIDLVAGRARGLQDYSDTDQPSTGETEAAIIKTTRGYNEIDKAPQLKASPVEINEAEGDLNFTNDASRIYISMKTNGDKNFAKDSDGYSFPQWAEKDDVMDAPYIVVKSNEIRIIARHNDSEDGSIRIIKEGETDEDHSSVDGRGRGMIQIGPDGSVYIDGPTIVIGSGNENGNGEGDQVYIGDGATEPLVMGSELKGLLEEILDELKTHTHLGPSGPTGVPLAASVSKFSQIKGNLSNMLSKVGMTK